MNKFSFERFQEYVETAQVGSTQKKIAPSTINVIIQLLKEGEMSYRAAISLFTELSTHV